MAGDTTLTRDEAMARSRDLRVGRYDIDIDMTGLRDGSTISTTSRVAFTATPGSSTFIECSADVTSATLNGTTVPANAIADGRIHLDGLAADNVVTVSATQSDTARQAGIHRVDDDGDVYVWMAFEPYDAHRVWACFDQPDLKAPHAFTVTAPAEWLVCSNTGPEDVTASDDDTRVWRFPDTPPLSTYVVVVNAGPFHELRVDRDGRSLGIYCRRTLADRFERDAEWLFDLTARGLVFFGDRFGVPFAADRYDQVFVPEMPGALENWGCVTWGDFFIVERPLHDDRSWVAAVLLHELAHMWFGDLVTMRWWDDLWLNESFASWASVWALEHISDEFADGWAVFVLDRQRRAHGLDIGPGTHPIQPEVDDTSRVFATFDMITYAKGQSVLRQLVAAVGEDAFLSGMRAYFTEHAWGNTTVDDLLRAIGAAAGRDLTGWARAWLHTSGRDTLTLGPGGLTITHDGQGPRPHRLDIAGYRVSDEGALVATDTVAVCTTGAHTPVAVPDADVHVVNAGSLTFAAARTSPAATDRLLAHAATLPTSVDRAQAVATAWDLLITGEGTAAAVVATACAVARGEQGPGIVKPCLALAHQAAAVWAPDGHVDDLLAQVADTAAALTADGPHRAVALQVLADTAVTRDHFAIVEAAPPDDLELAWRLAARRAAVRAPDQAALDDLVARDHSAGGRAWQLAVQAATPDPDAKARAWRALFDDHEITDRLQMDHVGSRLFDRGHADLTEPLVTSWLRELAAVPEAGAMFARARLQVTAPLAVVDERLVAGLTALADDRAVHPLVPPFAAATADTARRILRARSTLPGHRRERHAGPSTDPDPGTQVAT
jgi:aminopeptidase N